MKVNVTLESDEEKEEKEDEQKFVDVDDAEEKINSSAKSQFANFSVLSLLGRKTPEKEKEKQSQGGNMSIEEDCELQNIQADQDRTIIKVGIREEIRYLFVTVQLACRNFQYFPNYDIFIFFQVSYTLELIDLLEKLKTWNQPFMNQKKNILM